jgi:hypothetical protein
MAEQPGCEGLLGGFLSVILTGPVDFVVRADEAFPQAVTMAVVVCDPARVAELTALAATDPSFRLPDFPGCRLMTMPEFEALQQGVEL